MLLAIDVGNTNMVFGLFDGEQLTGSFRLMTDTNRTSDEIGLTAYQYCLRFGLTVADVTDVIIASVVPQVMHTLSSAMIRYFDRTPIIVGDDVEPGLIYGITGDERLGPDRSMACISAITKYSAPLVVLDFGTATTIDAINEAGAYMGGCIMAGVRISTDALFHKAAMLPKVELVKPDTVLGTTTVGQIQAGAVLGYIGAMEYLIRATKVELNCPTVRVVATGGLARMVAENTNLIDIVDSQLVLDGLRILYERYKAL